MRYESSMQAAHEMLDKKPSIYSGRPRMVFDAEIAEQKMVLANLSDPEGYVDYFGRSETYCQLAYTTSLLLII